MKNLLAEIERVLPDGGGWCTYDKAATLASLIVGLRPRIICELGVWTGGSAIPMLLAVKHVGIGHAILIDSWSPSASVIGQDQINADWWQNVDHNAAYEKFMARLKVHDLEPLCTVMRLPSDQCEPPTECQLLHVDGNHAEQAIRDVERFGATVTIGGVMMLDDLDWQGGAVRTAYARAREMGFEEIGPLGTGVLMQRRSLARG